MTITNAVVSQRKQGGRGDRVPLIGYLTLKYRRKSYEVTVEAHKLTIKPAITNPKVAAVYLNASEVDRAGLLQLRGLIFEIAAETEGVGEIEETLKWGQPAYLTRNKSGTTIRLGLPKTGGFAIYTHCQTNVISDFQALFPDEFTYEGNRAIHFQTGEAIPVEPVSLLVKNALTYHL